MDLTKISNLESDALKEVMNVGTAHAVNAVAMMIGKKVMISVPNLSLIPLKAVPEKVAREKGVEQIIVGLYFKIYGDLSGNILLIFPKESAERLKYLLLGKNFGGAGKPLRFGGASLARSGEKKEEDDEIEKIHLERSALMEVGNILTNSYLNALAAITDFTLFPSIPHYAEDMLGAVLDYLLIEISKNSDSAIFMETEFSAEDVSLSGDFLIFPDSDSLEKILGKIGLGA